MIIVYILLYVDYFIYANFIILKSIWHGYNINVEGINISMDGRQNTTLAYQCH
jgi:hypothetical protein